MPRLVVAETGIRGRLPAMARASCGSRSSLTYSPSKPAEPEPRPAPWGDQRRPDARPFSARVLEGDEGRIVDRCPGPATVELGEDADRLTEQEQRLVDQVRAEVTMRTARLVRVLAPRVGERDADLEARLDAVDRPERALCRRATGRSGSRRRSGGCDRRTGPGPPGAAASTSRSASAMPVAIGLSTTTWRPASSARMPSGTWVPIRRRDHDDLDIGSVERARRPIHDGRLRVLAACIGLPVGPRGGDRGDAGARRPLR